MRYANIQEEINSDQLDILNANPGNIAFVKQQLGAFAEILTLRGAENVLVIEPIEEDDDDQQDQN